MSNQNQCIFCNIINKTVQRKIYEENEDLIVIAKPEEKRKIKLSVNILIIPKKHIDNFKTLDPQDTYDATLVSKMAFMAKYLSQKLSGSSDFWISVNNGVKAKQTVPHLHMHFKSWEKWA